MTNRSHTTSIETYTGEFIDYLDPHTSQIHIEDVARGLAYECRFGRQVNRFYSVAEHALHVESLVTEPGLKLAALHHDSHEAYLGDLPAPLKWALAGVNAYFDADWEDTRGRLDLAIGRAFGFQAALFQCSEIKQADDEAMFREAAALKYSHGEGEHWGNAEHHVPLAGIGLTPDEAERAFLQRHQELTCS